MPFLEVEKFNEFPSNRCKYACDHCGMIFYRTFKTRLAHNNNPWFCSGHCSGLGRFALGITKENLHSKSNRVKAAESNKKGADQMMKTHKKTIMSKYGVENISQIKEVKQKKKDSAQKHYGVNHPAQSQEVKDKTAATNLERYGTICPMTSPEIANKIKTNNLEKYGCESPFGNDEIIAKSKETLLVHYGVDHPWKIAENRLKDQYKNAWKVAHETKKRNGVYKTVSSKIEVKFFELLKELYPEAVRQELLNNNWPIDFYLPKQNIYLEFDGIYWHGLNKPIKEIESSLVPRDASIVRRYYKDRLIDNWCQKNAIKLLRVTDLWFKQIIKEGNVKEEIMKLITEFTERA